MFRNLKSRFPLRTIRWLIWIICIFYLACVGIVLKRNGTSHFPELHHHLPRNANALNNVLRMDATRFGLTATSRRPDPLIPVIDGKVDGGIPRKDRTMVDVGIPRQDRTYVDRQATAAERILAVGYYSSEQLTRSMLQLADLLKLSMGLNRHMVLPDVYGGYFVSLGGGSHIVSHYRRKVNTEVIPMPLSAYFDLTDIRRLLKAGSNAYLVSDSHATTVCRGRWTILYLVTDNINQPSVCRSESGLHEREALLVQRLQSATTRSDAIANCPWLEDCLKPSVLAHGPFHDILCAAVPRYAERKWNMADLVTHLDVVNNSQCLLMHTWIGSDRYHIRNVLPDTTTSTLSLTSFKPTMELRQISNRIRTASGLGSNYTVIHVRTEQFLKQYEWEHPNANARDPEFIKFCLRCFQSLLAVVKHVDPWAESLLLAFDARSGTLPESLGRALPDLQRSLLDDLKRTIPSTRIRIVDDIVDQYSSPDEKKVLANPGMRTLVDTELLVSGQWMFVVGGGSFQANLYAMHEDRNPRPAIQSRTYAICHPSIEWNLRMAAKRLPYIASGLVRSNDTTIMNAFPFRLLKTKIPHR
eukprot:scpid66939/ scgid21019/ 